MKCKYIEIIGVSGSGKSYTENEVRNSIKSEIKIYNRREIILKFYNKILNLGFKEKLILIYFNLINILKNNKKINQLSLKENKNLQKKTQFNKKIKSNITNYFRIRYFEICKKFYILFCIKNVEFKKEVNKLFKNLDKLDKKLVQFWFYELCAAYYIFDKIKPNNCVFLNDEGFVTKSNLFIHTKNGYKRSTINNYLRTIPYPDLCIHLKKREKEIHKVHEQRKKFNIEMYLDKNFLKKIYKIDKYIIKLLKNKTHLIELINDHKITKKIIQLITKL